MIITFNHGEVRYCPRNKSFILFACDCYVEYEITEDDWENPTQRVTDHNLNTHSLQIDNDTGTYFFNKYGSGLTGVNSFINGTLKPLDENLIKLFRHEFQRIMLKEKLDAHASHLVSQYFAIFRKNNLFPNQVTIHEED